MNKMGWKSWIALCVVKFYMFIGLSHCIGLCFTDHLDALLYLEFFVVFKIFLDTVRLYPSIPSYFSPGTDSICFQQSFESSKTPHSWVIAIDRKTNSPCTFNCIQIFCWGRLVLRNTAFSDSKNKRLIVTLLWQSTVHRNSEPLIYRTNREGILVRERKSPPKVKIL